MQKRATSLAWRRGGVWGATGRHGLQGVDVCFKEDEVVVVVVELLLLVVVVVVVEEEMEA